MSVVTACSWISGAWTAEVFLYGAWDFLVYHSSVLILCISRGVHDGVPTSRAPEQRVVLLAHVLVTSSSAVSCLSLTQDAR